MFPARPVGQALRVRTAPHIQSGVPAGFLRAAVAGKVASMARKYALTTLGCKVNQYESQVIRETLESLGFQPAREGETVDIAAVNTCAITSSASAKSRQAIRRLSRDKQTPVIVFGCGVAADPERISKIAGVAATLDHGVDVRSELRRLLAPPSQIPARSGNEPSGAADIPDGAPGNAVWMSPVASRRLGDATNSLRVRPQDTSNGNIVSRPSRIVKFAAELDGRITRFSGHQRAFLKVQDGCDAYCSYCIVPRLRPQMRSKPVDAAVAEARELVRAGHKEIVITGIFLGAYGQDTAVRKRFRPGASALATLVRAISEVEGLRRLRLSSLEPGDFDDTLLEVLAARDNCVPHLHLPVQSGSADILRRMNRQYTIEAFIATVDRVRHALDRPAITTDVIVGFPGETEEDFQASLEVASYAQFAKIHAFPYSAREKTPAALKSDRFILAPVMRERMARLAQVERECSAEFRGRFVGEVERVLVEDDGRAAQAAGAEHVRTEPARRTCRGRADRYFEICFEADDVAAGDLVRVSVERVTPGRTHGRLIPFDSAACA